MAMLNGGNGRDDEHEVLPAEGKPSQAEGDEGDSELG
jgi:hypothetical protein